MKLLYCISVKKHINIDIAGQPMIIGSEFSKKYQLVLKEIGRLSENKTARRIPVQKINHDIKFDRTEIKHVLEYLEELHYIKIETIGGPFLYGHVTITEQGLDKYFELCDNR